MQTRWTSHIHIHLSKDWHHPAQLGRKRLLDHYLDQNWSRTHEWKLMSPYRGDPAMAVQSAGGEQWGLLTSLIFTEKDEDLSMSPKASLPPWQIGLSFKSQSPFLFFKNTMYKNKKKRFRSNKQNKINTWSPLRTFGH